MTKPALIILATVATLPAQRLSYGVKLGSTIEDASAADPLAITSHSRWTGGPFIELHGPRRLSLEFSALSRTSSESQIRPTRLGDALNPYLFAYVDKVRTWDFPLLLKYRFSGGRVRPYVGVGGAWSHRRSEFLASVSCLGPQGSCRPAEVPSDLKGGVLKSTLTRFGPAASAGLDLPTRYVTISPEVRWNRSFSGGPARNHFSLLTGFAFGRH